MDSKTPEKQVSSLKRELDIKQAEIDKLKTKDLKKAVKEGALEGFSGAYKDTRTGAIFALKVLEPHEVRFSKTHLLKNETHFGDYTAEEFRQLFDKQ
jgi:hypothetical protein